MKSSRSSRIVAACCLIAAAFTSPASGSGWASVDPAPPPGPAAGGVPMAPRILEDDTERAVQSYRFRKGLPDLIRSTALDELARDHSRDMAIRGYAAHRSPDGQEMVDRAAAHGVSFLKIGENIARTRGAIDPVHRAVDGWIHSPGHRATLLDPVYSETGIGIAVDASGTVYFTQIFLRRFPDTAAPR